MLFQRTAINQRSLSEQTKHRTQKWANFPAQKWLIKGRMSCKSDRESVGLKQITYCIYVHYRSKVWSYLEKKKNVEMSLFFKIKAQFFSMNNIK